MKREERGGEFGEMSASTASPDLKGKKANSEGKKPKKSSSDSESDDEAHKPAPLERSSTQAVKEFIKQNFESKGPRDFTKLRILGRGGVGRVYLVQLKGTDKLFAMKVLKQDEMISRNKVRNCALARSSSALCVATFYPYALARCSGEHRPLLPSLRCHLRPKNSRFSRVSFVVAFSALLHDGLR